MVFTDSNDQKRWGGILPHALLDLGWNDSLIVLYILPLLYSVGLILSYCQQTSESSYLTLASKPTGEEVSLFTFVYIHSRDSDCPGFPSLPILWVNNCDWLDLLILLFALYGNEEVCGISSPTEYCGICSGIGALLQRRARGKHDGKSNLYNLYRQHT